MHADIFTDGSSLGNPGPGGFAAIITWNGRKQIVKGGEGLTTNNRMEMSAIIAGLYWMKENLPDIEIIRIYSDSRLVIQTMLDGWKRKKNSDLWDKFDTLIPCFKKIDWIWIKGHAGNPGNTEADKIAVGEAMKAKRRSF